MKTAVIIFTCLIAIVTARPEILLHDEHHLHVPDHIPVEVEHVKLESKIESKIGDKKIEIAVLVPSTLKPTTDNTVAETSEKVYSSPKKWKSASASRSKQPRAQFEEKPAESKIQYTTSLNLNNSSAQNATEEKPEHHGEHDEARRKAKHYHDMKIVQLESDIEENGKYHYGFESEDGTIVTQEGEMKQMDDENQAEVVQGGYSFTDEKTGETYSVTYVADENGFHPQGAHIPTIPPAIARSLAYQATAKPWVDPWLVEQKRIRDALQAAKSDKNQDNKIVEQSKSKDEKIQSKTFV